MCNNVRRFHVFVANRVRQICDLTTVKQWRYVPTEFNPAVVASRGLSAQPLIDSKQWWFGPDFLWSDFDAQFGKIDGEEAVNVLVPDNTKLKKSSVLATKVDKRSDLVERLNRFSNWHKAKVAMALCLRYKKILIACRHDRTSLGIPTSDQGSCEPVLLVR